MQLLFCVENKDSDSLYINKLLKELYSIRGTKINFISFNGKGNYNKVEDVINSKSICIETKVIYVIDTDKQTNPDDVKLNQDIINYCKEKNYEIIWFCENIEECILGKKVNRSEKTNLARQFMRKKDIEKSILEKFKIGDYNKLTNKKSNFDIVIKKYLK